MLAAIDAARRRIISSVSRRLPRSIAARLYCLGILTLGSMLVLALGSMYYLERTERVVIDIRDNDVRFATASAEIELLLERHRRVTEAAPAQLGRSAYNRNRRITEALAYLIRKAIKDANIARLSTITGAIEDMVLAGRAVLLAASKYDSVAASEALRAYRKQVDAIQTVVRLNRVTGVEDAERSVSALISSGHRLQSSIIVFSAFALLIVLPLSALILRSIISRIKTITNDMRRAALLGAGHPQHQSGMEDEIGEMARALEVFKSNAATLMTNTGEMEKLNAWFHIALNNMARGLSMFDSNGRLLVCNTRYQELYSLPASVVKPGTPFEEISAYWFENSPQATGLTRDDMALWYDKLLATIEAGQPFTELHDVGGGRVIFVNTQPLEGGGWVDLHEDITDKRAAEERIEQLARFDTLTGLANRHHFREQLDQSFRNLGDQAEFALLWFDLDRFKAVNDTFGHPAGDELLRLVAERLRRCVRATDFIARLGGDEFAIIAPIPDGDIAGVTTLGERVLRKLSAPYDVSGKMVSVGASIGIAMAPAHGMTADTLIYNADIALYRAKTRGRGKQVLFNDNLEAEITVRDRLEADLRRALASGELRLHYQPIINITEGRVAVCEALMRWQHPTRGMVSPGEFIPLAEEAGLISAMGEWALRQACRDAVLWPDGIRVSVNMAATQFTSSDVLGAVTAALEMSGLPAKRLVIEVTETIMLKDNAATLEALQALRAMGVRIALDDFGTGYASLSYLRSFPFDKIKIDQCFVKDIAEREDCFEIVKAIVSLTKSLGMTSVAEGVETVESLQTVMASGCNEAQGYYFSRPVDATELPAAFLAVQRKCAAAMPPQPDILPPLRMAKAATI